MNRSAHVGWVPQQTLGVDGQAHAVEPADRALRSNGCSVMEAVQGDEAPVRRPGAEPVGKESR